MLSTSCVLTEIVFLGEEFAVVESFGPDFFYLEVNVVEMLFLIMQFYICV